MQPGDAFMGLSLDAGGHLTHGSPVNQSGKWFKPVPYSVRRQDHRIDMDEVEALARDDHPRLIIAGGSAYSRIIDFSRFREIADSIGAYFMVDMAHFAGLVAGGVHPNPLDHAHVVTTTTHKTLRGPRGGMILSRDPDLGKKINSSVFPGLQGGPLMHVIAAKAVAFGEALRPEFKAYAHAVVENASTLAETLHAEGLDIVSGGTDTHLMLVDLRPKGATGRATKRRWIALVSRATRTQFRSIRRSLRSRPVSGWERPRDDARLRSCGISRYRQMDCRGGRCGRQDRRSRRCRGRSSVAARVADLCKRFPIYS